MSNKEATNTDTESALKRIIIQPECDCHSYNADIGHTKEKILRVYKYFERCEDKELTVCIDACISEQIKMLWQNDIWTIGSCCGHNGIFGDKRPTVCVDVGENAIKAKELLKLHDPNREWIVQQWQLKAV